MKKLANSFLAIVTLLLILGEVTNAQTTVKQWGSTPRGNAWPILNTAATVAGNASMGADAKPSGWASIRGTFDSPLTATTTQAVVVTGTFEFVGGGAGSAYTWLRYAIIGDDGAVLSNANTPTAAWTNGTNASAYQFTPRTGTGEMANGGGGSGVVWTVTNAAWTSTYSNGGGPLITVQQAPYRAVATAGVYNWAISVQPLANGTNEIRWYFEKQHAANVQTTYWCGGITIDPKPVTTRYSAIGFACNNDLDATCKQVNLTNVKAGLGAPITVTDAPFEAFYVNQWGSTPRGNAWPILNDANTIDGDGAMGADAKPSAWASIRGGFRMDVVPTLKKALVITGTYEMVGGGAGSAYTWLRYALTYQDSCTLNNAGKPTANWTTKKNSFGYQFTPRTGVGDLANGGGGSGVVWTVNNSAAWNSTYSNNGGPLVTVLQAPNRAIATAGVYNWAISVQPLADGTNEIRWYFEKQHAANVQTTYWVGGTCIDKTPVATKFNGINFSVNNDVDATCKQVKIANVKVDLADPIVVPDRPFQSFYVAKWGFLAGKDGGWTMTPGDVTGNVAISGKKPAAGWASIRGEFDDLSTGTSTKSLVVTGKMELVGGGFDTPNSFQIGLVRSDNAGTLNTTYNTWEGNDGGTSGYAFVPTSGGNPVATWGTKTGTVAALVNDTWLGGAAAADYVVSSDRSFADGISKAGVYNLNLSVTPNSDGSQEVRWFINSTDKKFAFGGTVVDKHAPVATKLFNAINFAIFNTVSATGLKLTDIKVDQGAAITVPVNGGVAVRSELGIPTEYALNQNYPNPFNPTTTIQFALPQSGNVSLVVYDLLGRSVAKLVDGDLSAGYHTFNFNASNLASGVYFYKLKAGNFESVKKLMLMK